MMQPHPEAPLGLLLGAPIQKRRPYSWLAVNQPTSTGATLEALIRDAIIAKRSALWWQAYITQRKTRPFCPTYARASAEYFQKRLVHLLTQIIAGDEATLAAHEGQP